MALAAEPCPRPSTDRADRTAIPTALAATEPTATGRPAVPDTYQSKPDSLASQVQCIAGITCVCLAVLTLISAAIGFFLSSHAILQITMIVLIVGLMLCVIVAAVAEPFVNRHEATDMEPRRAR